MTDAVCFAPTDAPLSWGIADAIEAGTAEPIDWIEIELPDLDLVVEAPRLPLRMEICGRLLCVSASYREQVRVCRALECVSPTHELQQAIFRASRVRLVPHPQVRTPADALRMGNLDFLTRENDFFEAELAKHAEELADPEAFARGFCKEWLVGLLMLEQGALHGAENEGFQYPDGHELQHEGGAHNDAHLDYSQWLWNLLRRWARKLSTGERVDLLDRQRRQFPALAARLTAEYGA